MARGTQVIVSTEPHGRFMEGIISGTPLPGTFMEMTTANITAGQGRFTWQAYSGRGGTDGARELISILDADWDQGQTFSVAYVTGTRCFMYVPLAGEEFNCVVEDVGGTAANAYTIGQYLMVAGDTAKLEATSGPTLGLMDNFQSLEAPTAPLVSYHMWVRYLGAGG